MNRGKTLTEVVERCPACGAEGSELLIQEAPDLLTSSPRCTFNVWRCQSCESAFVSPRPRKEHMGVFYPASEYLPITDLESLSSKTMGKPGNGRVKRAVRRLCDLPYRLRYGSPGTTFPPFGNRRILDVGCGQGLYLADMHKEGWDVYGCDISREKVECLSRVFGPHHVLLGEVDALSFPGGFFDAVSLWHVIEHLYDSASALQRVYELLRPGGRLVIGTPNATSPEARTFGRWWVGYDVPRHLVVFSRRSLLAQLERAGFAVTGVRPSLWATSAPDSVAFYFKGRFGWNIWKSRVHKGIHCSLYPLVSCSRVLGNSSVIEVTAVRP